MSRRRLARVFARLVGADFKSETLSEETEDNLRKFLPLAKKVQARFGNSSRTVKSHLLEPERLELRTGPETDAPRLTRGTDYEADLAWATIGRLTNDVLKEGQPVFATYRHGLLRIDSIILTSGERIVFRPGEAKPAAPRSTDVGGR